jgi:hypothetical protein
MSTNFEKKIFMPGGPLGPTTALGGGKEQRIIRWYRKEWEQFLVEIEQFKKAAYVARYDLRMRIIEERAKCPRCRRTYDAMQRLADATIRHPALKKYQRGSLSGMSIKRAVWTDALNCTYTASTVPNLSDTCVQSCVARVRARLHSDGDWYWAEGTTSWGTSKGTWQGDCAIADYDGQWNTVSGDAPTEGVSGSNGVWQAMSTEVSLGHASTLVVRSGSYNLKLRDGTTLVELFTDTFTMYAETTLK